MIKRLWSWITGGRLVWLKDADGEVTLAIAYQDPWGNLMAERYFPWSIRKVTLLPDGSVDGCYVKKWKYAE